MAAIPPYPLDADATVRRVAKLLHQQSPLDTLDMIKNRLLGNAAKAETIGHAWAENKVMTTAKERVNGAKDNLAGYWEGGAATAFNSYVGNVSGVLDRNLVSMGQMGSTLGNCVATVMRTYSAALTFIGNCAADLVGLTSYAGLALATITIPGVDLLSIGALATKAIDTLSDFVRNVTALVSQSVTQIGEYKQQAVNFAAAGTTFQSPEELPGATTHVGEWHVHPNR